MKLLQPIKYAIFCIILLLFTLVHAQQIVMKETFDDDSMKSSFSEKDFVGNVSNGQFIIKNNSTRETKYRILKPGVPFKKVDFEIETAIQITQSLTDNAAFGFLYSMDERSSKFQAIEISANKQARAYNRSSTAKIVDKEWDEAIPVFGKNKYNKIKVKKTSDKLEIFINDNLFYSQSNFDFKPYTYGFVVSEGVAITVDYVKITEFPEGKSMIDVIDSYNPNAEMIKIKEISMPDHSEMNPIVTTDEKTIYWTIKNHPQNVGGVIKGVENDDIWYSTKLSNDNWDKPRNMSKPLNNAGPNFIISVAPGNNSLIIANTYHSDATAKGGGLSVATRTINGWSIPTDVIIKDLKNTNKYGAFCQSYDGKSILMSIQNSLSIGKNDLYVSFLQPDNSWSMPINLGKTINTIQDDTSPYLAADGKTLYFASKGYPGYGDYDLFVSKRLDDSWTNWSSPKNLGNVVNSNGSELSYFVNATGTKAYISSKGDIYVLDNNIKQDPIAQIKGFVFDAKTKKPLGAKVDYFDLKTNEKQGLSNSNPIDGSFSIILPAGQKYSFKAVKEGYYSITENIDITKITQNQETTVNLYLNPIVIGETIRLNNLFFPSAKFDLLSESFAELNNLIKVLNDNPKMKIAIYGHTDDIGADADNLKLSQNRANAVLQYLVQKGIAATRLSAKGFGKSKYLVANNSEQNRQINRRVEFTIAEN